MVFVAGFPMRYVLVIPLIVVAATVMRGPDGYTKFGAEIIIEKLKHAFQHMSGEIDDLHDELDNANDAATNAGDDLKKTERDLARRNKELGTANELFQMAALNNVELVDDKYDLQKDYAALNARHIALVAQSRADALDSKNELERKDALLAEKDEMIENFTTTIAQLQANVTDLMGNVQSLTPKCWLMSGWYGYQPLYAYTANPPPVVNVRLNGGWIALPNGWLDSTFFPQFWLKEDCHGIAKDSCVLQMDSIKSVFLYWYSSSHQQSFHIAICADGYVGKTITDIFEDCFKPRPTTPVTATNWVQHPPQGGADVEAPESADVEFKYDANTKC